VSTVIKIENLSKQYRLGLVGTGTLSHDLNRWWAALRGKDDPYLMVGETNVTDEVGLADYVWALNDINLSVDQGEVLGIIGKNGAGKSTLLKILSRVTGPTKGRLKVKGRIASLLEVGTGFHPELTGRENIFLNGAILGMTKAEIRIKLDEIIDFSGVERYIDTPVKRYSSGMYVRLAFAVAAHLEPEILIIDEVLAVGDAEFQKRCLGKMKDVAGEGRTVLFVSHNMQSVRRLCTRGILLNNGQIELEDSVHNVIERYTESAKSFALTNKAGIVFNEKRRNTDHVRFNEIYLVNDSNEKTYSFKMGDPIKFCFEYEVIQEVRGVAIYIALKLLTTDDLITSIRYVVSERVLNKGVKGKLIIEIPKNRLRPGEYPLYFQISESTSNKLKEDVVDDLTPRLIILLNDKMEIKDFNPFIPRGCFDIESSIVESQLIT